LPKPGARLRGGSGAHNARVIPRRISLFVGVSGVFHQNALNIILVFAAFTIDSRSARGVIFHSPIRSPAEGVHAMTRKKNRLAPEPANGLVDSDAPFWRGDTAERVLEQRLK